MRLTPREKQVIDLVKTGASNKAIAHELHLSEGTTRVYMTNIMGKLRLDNRTQVAIWALTQSEGLHA